MAKNLAMVLGVVLAGVVLAGCRSGGSDSHFADVPGLTGAPLASAKAPGSTFSDATAGLDVVQNGDAVTITFKDMPTTEPPIEDRVKEDGTITLLQNQTFHVAGKTRSQIEKEIHDRYVPSFFKTMTVSFIHTPQTRFYYVDGEVKAPSRQVYISQVTVLKAISSAGGFTDFAQKKKVKLTRADGRLIVVNCVKANEDPNLDLPVFPGDKIYVPRRWF